VLRHERLMRVRQLAAYSVASVTVASDAECGKRRTSWGPSRYRYSTVSKVRDGSAERNGRPRGAAVFDFFDFVPGTLYEPAQLVLQSIHFRRPDPGSVLQYASSF
jgi:hypothetical protein